MLKKRFLMDALLALIFFILCVIIALFWDGHPLIRGFFGDVTVMGFIYFAVRTIHPFPSVPLAIGVLAFAFAVEFAQFFRIIDHLGLSGNRAARIILGATFDVFDLAAYTLGAGMAMLADHLAHGRTKGKPEDKQQ